MRHRSLDVQICLFPGGPHLDCFTKCLPWNLFCDKYQIDQSNVAIKTGENMFNQQLKRGKTRNFWGLRAICYFLYYIWKTWNIPGFDFDLMFSDQKNVRPKRHFCRLVITHSCYPMTGSLADCSNVAVSGRVYVYTVGCLMLSSGTLAPSSLAEIEDKYTNPVDRKETETRLAWVGLTATCWRWDWSFFCSTCGEVCIFLYPWMVRAMLKGVFYVLV